MSEQLLRRVEELLSVLEMATRELAEVVKALREMTGKPIVSPIRPAGPIETMPLQSKPKRLGIDDTKVLFPNSIADMLNFEETKDFVVIKPKQFLGSESFAKIAAIIRDGGGEYISAGKESHFRIPKQA